MTRPILIATSALALTLAGCATTGTGSAVDRARGQCMLLIGGGALLGAVIGNNVGDGDAGAGLGIGLVAGSLACAVSMALASEEDQRRIAEVEMAALEAGELRQTTYVGRDGKSRTIQVAAMDISDPAGLGAGERTCRTRQTTATVQGIGTHAYDQQVFCRNPDTLAWEPYNA